MAAALRNQKTTFIGDLRVEHQNHRQYWIAGSQTIRGFEYAVAGDLSFLAFPLAAALITGGEVAIHGMDLNDGQGDGIILEIVQAMGAKIQ